MNRDDTTLAKALGVKGPEAPKRPYRRFGVLLNEIKASGDMDPVELAKSLGVTVGSISRQLYRAGSPERARRFERARGAERRRAAAEAWWGDPGDHGVECSGWHANARDAELT